MRANAPFLVLRYARSRPSDRKRITIAHQAVTLGEALGLAYGWRGLAPVWIERRGQPARSPWRRS